MAGGDASAPCVGTLCWDDGPCDQGFACCRLEECEDGQGVCCDEPCDVYPCEDDLHCQRFPGRPTCRGLEDDTVCGPGLGYCDVGTPCVGTLCPNDDNYCPEGFACCRQHECQDDQGVCCDEPCDVYPCEADDGCQNFPGRPTCYGTNDPTVCGEGLGYCDA